MQITWCPLLLHVFLTTLLLFQLALTEESSSLYDEPNCSNYSTLLNTVPLGKAEVPHTLLGAANDIEACVRLCCNIGKTCENAWLFGGHCYSVSCTNVDKELCKPDTVGFNSVYLWIHREDKPINNEDDKPMNNEDDTPMNNEDDTPINNEDDTPTNNEDYTSMNNEDDTPINNSVTDNDSLSHITTNHGDDTPTNQHNDYDSDTNQDIFISTAIEPSLSQVLPLTQPPIHPPHSTAGTFSHTVVPVTTPPSTTITGNDKHMLYKTVTVAIDNNNIVITLPNDNVKVFGSTWPIQDDYHYQWTKVSGPASGDLIGIHDKVLELKNLVEGNYSLRFTVYDNAGNYGNTTVNITVEPEPHVNKPPVVVISPKSGATYSLPVTTVILDASGSTDDGGFDNLSFKWQLVGGPLQALKEDESNWRKPLLKLSSPVDGTYQFKLTVTDAIGLSTMDVTNFTVFQEKDYPPVANAGSAILLHLPNNEVMLSGEGSRDDKGIVKYEWSELEGRPVDTEGTNSRKLHLTHLEAGLYQFKLVVTDTIGQTASATVTVDVQEEDNQPPIAVLVGNVTVHYPETVAILNGSLSYDDYQIISYNWTQISGPIDIQLKGKSKPALQVSGLHIIGESPTVYRFSLEVTDYRNLTNSVTATVTFYKDEELLPIVSAGKDVMITLPERTAIMNGSLSHDGFGIVSYQWTRSYDSPAAGSVVGNSDHTSILILTDLINGTYNLSLTVTNSNSKSNTDFTILTVQRDPNEEYLTQIYLNEIIYKFNQSDLESLEDQLVLKLHQLHYKVHVQDVSSHDQHILVEFYVTDNHGDLVNSTIIYSSLLKEGHEFQLGKYHVTTVEEKVCHNSCSNRGYCDHRTKQCVCSMFWLENPFKANFGKRQSNCDWSLLYVILIVMTIVCIFLVGLWLCCCFCIKRCITTRRKVAKRRKVKYAILDHKENEGDLQMFPRGSQSKNRSLIVTESETEEEILYETNSKKGNNKQEKKSLIPKNNNSALSIKVLRNDLSNSKNS